MIVRTAFHHRMSHACYLAWKTKFFQNLWTCDNKTSTSTETQQRPDMLRIQKTSESELSLLSRSAEILTSFTIGFEFKSDQTKKSTGSHDMILQRVMVASHWVSVWSKLRCHCLPRCARVLQRCFSLASGAQWWYRFGHTKLQRVSVCSSAFVLF